MQGSHTLVITDTCDVRQFVTHTCNNRHIIWYMFGSQSYIGFLYIDIKILMYRFQRVGSRLLHSAVFMNVCTKGENNTCGNKKCNTREMCYAAPSLCLTENLQIKTWKTNETEAVNGRKMLSCQYHFCKGQQTWHGTQCCCKLCTQEQIQIILKSDYTKCSQANHSISAGFTSINATTPQ